MAVHKLEVDMAGRQMTLETGRLAGLADGAVLVRYGDSVLLATAVSSTQPREGIDFFPLTVEYEERMYAAGKIPGGFIKREGRPGEQATLAARLTDRPIRPLLPKYSAVNDPLGESRVPFTTGVKGVGHCSRSKAHSTVTIPG